MEKNLVDLCVHVARDADEKEQWICALENAISRRDPNQVCAYVMPVHMLYCSPGLVSVSVTS